MADDFDPNAYLKTAPTPQQFDPDAYLKTPVTQIGAAMEGVKSGASLGFGDEITGAYHASGVPEMLAKLDPKARVSAIGALVSAIGGAGKMAYEKLTGDEGTKGEATTKYEVTRDESRAVQKAAKEQFPKTFMGGEIAGSLALPIGGAAGAATLPARIARGAALGAGIGGASGFGEGEGLADSAAKAAIGVGVGGLTGGVAPPLIEGAARGAGALASYPINLARAAINPEGSAERAIGRAGIEATRADPNAINRLAAGEVTPGGPAAVIDTLGQSGRNLARSAANISGEARDVLNQTLDPRFEQQVPRLVNWVRQGLHYPDVHAQQQALEQTQKATNNRLYGVARQEGDRQVWSPELERLTGAPEVADAMRTAATKGKGRAILEGGGGFNPGVTVDNGGIVTFQRGPTGQPTYPNLQFWDYARRELTGEANKARRAGSSEEADRLGGLANLMNRELDQLVPSYRTARNTAAGFFGADNALEAGQRFVTENFAVPQTRAALAQMTPAERQLFQDGFAHRYIEMLSKVDDRADVVRRIYNNDTARQKIEIALGPQRARELEAMLRVENVMQQSLRAVQGNSTTAMQLLGAGLAGAGGGGFLGFDPSTSGLAAALATAGKRGIDHRVATRIATLLTSHDPAVLQRGAQAVANNPRLMDALRGADSAAARVGGQQAPNIPALQAAGMGRADQNDPNVPRPAAQ